MRRRYGSATDLTNDASLKASRYALPSGRRPRRVTDATSSCMRNVAALVDAQRPGDRRLDRRDVADRDHVVVAERRSIATERLDPCRHRNEALTAGRREVRIGKPRRPMLAADLGERPAVPVSVVELDQTFVDLDLTAQHRGDRRRGLPGPGQRTGEDVRDLPRRHPASRPRHLLEAAGESSTSTRPCKRPSRLRAVSPCRTKLIMRPRSSIAHCDREPSVAPQVAAAVRVGQAEPGPRPPRRPRARGAPRPPRSATARAAPPVGPRRAERRPPEHLLVRPRTAEHEAREPPDRQAQVTAAKEAPAPARGEAHHRRRARPPPRAACARTPARRTGGRAPAATGRRPRSGGSRHPGSGRRSTRRRPSRTRASSTIRGSSQSTIASSAALTSASASVFSLRGMCWRSTTSYAASNDRAAACSGRMFACLTFHSPRSCFTTRSESARTCMTRARDSRRRPRGRRSAPCTRRRCWS